MKLSDFILLPVEKKKTASLHDGILIAKRKDQNYFIFLFQLDSFYIEMYCNLRTKEVEVYRAFENTSALNPYLELIKINY
jgi:hypothetical protein